MIWNTDMKKLAVIFSDNFGDLAIQHLYVIAGHLVSIPWRVGLDVAKPSDIVWECFYFPAFSNLREYLVVWRIVGWRLFLFSVWNISLCFLLACRVVFKNPFEFYIIFLAF